MDLSSRKYLSKSYLTQILSQLHCWLKVKFKRIFGKSTAPVARSQIGEPSAEKPVAWIDAGIHAREWVAPATAVFLIHRVTDLIYLLVSLYFNSNYRHRVTSLLVCWSLPAESFAINCFRIFACPSFHRSYFLRRVFKKIFRHTKL